jgi:hypothetical protein
MRAPPSASMTDTSGWLFLFAVIMAAVLLFTMVFFVSSLHGWGRAVHVPLDSVHVHTPLSRRREQAGADLQIIMFSDLECGELRRWARSTGLTCDRGGDCPS